MVRIGGRTLLAGSLVRLGATEEIVVAAPREIVLPIPESGGFVRRVVDRPEGSGPLAGMAAAVEDGAFGVAIVLGVDFPFMSAIALMDMAIRLQHEPKLRAIVPAPGGRLQPLVAVYTRDATRELVAAFESGQRSIVRAVERLGGWTPDIPELVREFRPRGTPLWFFNLNTPEDLAEAERRLAERAAKP
jgi:molybdopterin-guanine dinucleotide biosynthesis protein A